MELGFTEYGRIRDHENWRDGIHQEKANRAVPVENGGDNYTSGAVPSVNAPGVVPPEHV